MSGTASLNLVHESEAQRQYARVRIPASIKISGQTYQVLDLSAGGFSLTDSHHVLEDGKIYQGDFAIKLDNFDFSYQVKFSVKARGDADRIGCEFQEIDARFSAALRYIITAFLSGELVSTGDMLNILGRENFTKGRSDKGIQKSTTLERIRALVGSLLFLSIGLLALGFVALQLFRIYFVTSSETAVVAMQQISLDMPKDGQFHSLIKAGQSTVKKGQIIGSYDTELLDVKALNLPAETLALLQTSLAAQAKAKGTLVSPCDCDIAVQNVVDGQFAQRGTPIFQLVQQGDQAFIEANFAFKQAQGLVIGDEVRVQVLGSGNFTQGKIEKLNVSDDGLRVTAKVSVEQGLEVGDLNVPAKVWVTPGYMPSFLQSLI